jgi:hypothetical protein
MSKRRVRTVILCEDLQHEVFVYRFLKQTGRGDARTVAARRSPKGRGSGVQFVLDHFPEEVRAYRSKANHLNLCLIVVIDADNLSVEDRIRQLEEALEENGQERRTAEERIVILVPKRNIETWIRYLNGHDFDETTSYSKLPQESECMPAVKRLVDLYPDGIQDSAPDSLLRSCVEARRCTPSCSVAERR